MIAGAIVLLGGLLAWLLRTHYRARRYFDRPMVARNPVFDPAIAVTQWVLLAAGLLILARASLTSAVLAGGLLGVGAIYRAIIRSVAFQRYLLRRDFRSLRARRPDLANHDILLALVMERHPRWGEELIDQMVRDYPTVEALARIVAKMDRGFRGFR